MRYVKIVTILFLVFIGSVVSAQANAGLVPTYEQTAKDMYEAYQESITQNLSDFNSSNKIDQDTLTEIEVNIAEQFGTSREQVQKMIASYKKEYVTAIKTEMDQLESNRLDEYGKEKKDLIQEEITEDVAVFLDDFLNE